MRAVGHTQRVDSPRVTAWLDELERTIPPHERRVLRIAHRGASAHAQENSANAIRIAAELGSDLVEVDVRVTADGVPVISHDDSLNRVYGVPGRIPRADAGAASRPRRR
ncbi:MAG: hypothetical protein HND48_02615 [Chloroflexi bacterium]|nr:hypothetical protein [Chloroflexota bacterium]